MVRIIFIGDHPHIRRAACEVVKKESSHPQVAQTDTPLHVIHHTVRDDLYIAGPSTKPVQAYFRLLQHANTNYNQFTLGGKQARPGRKSRRVEVRSSRRSTAMPKSTLLVPVAG
jgi:hypothetical protein